MKWLYRIVIGLLSFLLLSSLILWILSKTIKAETIRQYLNTQLTLLTSQRILIDGEVNWKLLPRPAIEITHITAGEINTKSPYKIHVDNLLLNLKIGPLLHGQLLFHELKINGLTARINTALFSQENPHLTTEKVEHLRQLLPEQLAIDQVMINHATLIVVRDNQELRISNLQLGAKPFNLLQNAFPFQFKGKIKLTDHNTPLFNATIRFNGNTLTNKSQSIKRPPLLLGLTGIKGQLTLTQANIESLHIDKLSASTLVTKPMIQLDPITLALYHGEATGSLKYELANQTLTLNQTATNLDATALFDALIHKKMIQGNLDYTVHSQTNLQTNAWPNNTQADGTVTIRKGVLLAFNLNRVIDEISHKITRLLQKERGSVASKTNTQSNDNANDNTNANANSFQLDSFDNSTIFQGNTPLKLLTISYQLQNGHLESDPIRLQTERLDLKGQNHVDLVNHYQQNGKLSAQVVFNNDNADNIQQLLGGSFPLLIGGTITEPTVVPDLRLINKQLKKAWLKNTLQKPIEVIKKPVNVMKNQINKIVPSHH